MSDWKNMDQWYLVLPPSRPTVKELKRIEEYISNIDRMEPVAVIGSTPEFRELLFGLGFHNRFIFDKSEEFYHRMSELIPGTIETDENFVIGDWLSTLCNYKSRFRIILSDLTMGNVRYEDRTAFYTNISSALKPGGTFIDKALVFDFETPRIDELFDKYESLPINLRTINDFSSEVLFCSELVKRKDIVDSTEFYQIIRSGPYSEKIQYFSNAAHMITPEGFLWYYGKNWDELKIDYSKYYSSQIIHLEEDEKSPYYHRTKQYFNIKGEQ